MTLPCLNAQKRLARLFVSRRRFATRPGFPVHPTPSPVDVIVPVYRGLADTRLCIDSVLASPVITPYRLIVINDASPEPELTGWLRQRAGTDQRILLLENAENLGFVKTVNRGMSLSDLNDVLILNSDTEVANDWIDRLRAAAYADARIASVTPFSTNATICSYPRFCQDNAMPTDCSAARLDELCARTNPGAVVDVPTGVGFCMYMRRDCLREIGLFDTEHFDKGYGEENDFCQRAAAVGWRNVHLLDTFVLHTGGVSFGDSRHPRQEAGMRALRRLHPRYEREIHTFIKADPARPARLALDLARIRNADRPVILAVLHNREGGTMRHVRELARHFDGQAMFLMLTPGAGKRVLLRLTDQAEGFELAFQLPQQFHGLVEVLRALNVRHVHFHHLLGHDAVVRELPRLLGVRYDFTVHDYYSYCTQISLSGTDGRYVGEVAPGQCRCCPPSLAAPDGTGTVAEWRASNSRLLLGARYVFAPSHDAARRIGGFAPGASVRVVGHTDLPPASHLPQPSPTPLRHTWRLRIVVLGGLGAIKGADVLEATALEAARRAAPIEFHLLGYGYRPLKSEPHARLAVHGEYKDADLPALLAKLKPHLAWFPAQWPETYSYTLSSVLTAGLPVVVPDVGAFTERVQGRPWSWVRRWDSTPTQWLDDFISIRERHFVSGTAPASGSCQPTGVDAAGAQDAAYSYARDYLANLPVTTAQEGAKLAVSDLEPFLPRETSTPRMKLLAAMTYLRMHPLLRGLACRIPASWRQRVNDWLSA